MNITVKSYHELKPLTDGLPDGQLGLADGETVDGALQRLGLSGKEQNKVVLFVNGRMARLDTRLADGDSLVFFSPVAGG